MATQQQRQTHGQYSGQHSSDGGVKCACNGFCGCTSPAAGLAFMIVIQLIAAGALITAGVLMEGYDAGALNIANGVIFILISLVLAAALIIDDRQFQTILIWVAILLHMLMIILCGGGIGWNAYNATIDWGWDCYDCSYGPGACIGGGANLVMFLLMFHFICIDNGYRMQICKKKTALQNHYDQQNAMQNGAMQHPQSPSGRPAARPDAVTERVSQELAPQVSQQVADQV
jgi:hypothetical protein